MYFLLIFVQLAIPPKTPWRESQSFFEELGLLRFLETIDQTTDARFLSFSDCRDELNAYLLDIAIQFSTKGGDTMRGITMPTILAPTNSVQPTWGSPLRRWGISPVPLTHVNRLQPR